MFSNISVNRLKYVLGPKLSEVAKIFLSKGGWFIEMLT